MDVDHLKKEAESIQEKLTKLQEYKFDFDLQNGLQGAFAVTTFVVIAVIIGLIGYITWWGLN
jgi:hypothetical protein